MDKPVMVTERTLVRRGMPAISRSIGKVTERSISSGAWPGNCEMTRTCTSCTSGKASIGKLDNA
ncbi:hypothetical protein D3C81_2274770 [compost metagenome]